MQKKYENSKEYIINKELSGIRLDKSITILDREISRMSAGRLLDEGNITVNRKD